MTAKKWIQINFKMTIAIILIIFCINYIFDVFNIFHSPFLKQQFQTNERFSKIEYLEENFLEFNSYMFGSSRIGGTKPELVEQYIPKSKFYNFTVASANMYDHLFHLKYFIKNYNIKHLYLQIDIDNMSSYGRSENDYLRKMHPYVLNQSIILFYFKYLSGFFPLNTKGKIELNYNGTDYEKYNIEQGYWTKKIKEKKIERNCQKFVDSEPTFQRKAYRTVGLFNINKILSGLEEIKELCLQNNIKLYVFTTPHHQKMMDSFIVDDYLYFLKEISKITSFYDFSGYNSVTMNNCNYYEISHYRPKISDMIAARIFKGTNLTLNPDFGVYVTRYNVDKLLKKRKKWILEYEKNFNNKKAIKENK